MLACARIGAPHNVVFGGFAPDSVRERMEVSHAKALITVDGARRKGKTDSHQARGRPGDVRPGRAPVDRGGPAHRHRLRDAGRPGRLLRRAAGQERPGLPGRAAAGGASAVHPLLVGLDREAEGHPAHHRRVPDRSCRHPPGRVRPAARLRRVLVHGRRRLGHRALLHRVRAARQRLHQRDVRGRAGLPGQGRLVGDHRALRRHDLLHRADRDPGLHEVGRRAPERPRPVVAAPARVGRRTDQPEGLAVVLRGGRAPSSVRSSTPGGRPRPARS